MREEDYCKLLEAQWYGKFCKTGGAEGIDYSNGHFMALSYYRDDESVPESYLENGDLDLLIPGVLM